MRRLLCVLSFHRWQEFDVPYEEDSHFCHFCRECDGCHQVQELVTGGTRSIWMDVPKWFGWRITKEAE